MSSAVSVLPGFMGYIFVAFILLIIAKVFISSDGDWSSLFVMIIPLIVIAVVWVCLFHPDIFEDKQAIAWHEWATNHCKITERVDGDRSEGVGLGLSMKGKPMLAHFNSSTSDKTLYECDDGVKYWRNE